MTAAIIDPPRTHNQVSIDELIELILADLKEQVDPLLAEWHGSDGKPGLKATWERYQKDRPVLLNEEQAIKATEFYKKLGSVTSKYGLIKSLDSLRTSASQPLKEGIATINAVVATYIKPIDEAAQGIQARLDAWAQLKYHEQQGPIAPLKSERGTSLEIRLRLEYEGIEDITKVPLEYLCVDEKKVRAAITKIGGVKSIPGLKIVEIASTVKK